MKQGLDVIAKCDVFVYRNLHYNCFSIRGKKSRRVLAHARSGFCVENACFKVYESGRQRVLKEKVKNVHAGVSGVFVTDKKPQDSSLLVKITYNPYLKDSFFEAESPNRKVSGASSVFFLEDGIYASGVIYNE